MTGLVPAWAVITVLVVALIAANLPFVNERVFFVGPRRENKGFWRVIELLVYASLVGLLGRALEAHLSQSSPLRWEFVAVGLCVFITLGFPGFIWRYLRKH